MAACDWPTSCVMHTSLIACASLCCIIIDSAPDKERENQACGYNVMMSLKKKKKKDRSSRGTWCPHGIRTWERYRPATTMTEWERFVCLFFFLLDIVGSLRRVSLFVIEKKEENRLVLISMTSYYVHHPRYIRESRIGYRLAGHTHNNKTVRPGHKMVEGGSAAVMEPQVTQAGKNSEPFFL